jgi:hypothetical protein
MLSRPCANHNLVPGFHIAKAEYSDPQSGLDTLNRQIDCDKILL